MASFVDRFLHHGDNYRVITLGGRIHSGHFLFNTLASPDSKLCLMFGAVCGAAAAVAAPDRLYDVARGTAAALILCQTGGRLMERLMFIDYSVGLSRQSYEDGIEDNWYRVAKAPAGETSILEEPGRKNIVKLSDHFARQSRRVGVASLALGGAVSVYAMARGVHPMVMSVGIPLLAGLNVRLLAAADRFQKLRDGRFSIIPQPPA